MVKILFSNVGSVLILSKFLVIGILWVCVYFYCSVFVFIFFIDWLIVGFILWLKNIGYVNMSVFIFIVLMWFRGDVWVISKKLIIY